MKILHAQAFEDQYHGDRFKTVVSNKLHTIHAEKKLQEHIADKETDEVFGKYKKEHGKTAQFWFGYIVMLPLYHEFI